MIKPHQRRWLDSPKGKATRAAQQARDNASGANKNRRLKTRYGLTLDQYNMLLGLQSGACAICRRKVSRFHVDHDHVTDQVRGIVCPACNRALGLIADSAQTARAMAAYLESDHSHVELVKELT